MEEFKTFFSIIILVSGIFLSAKTGWFQLTHLGKSIKLSLGIGKRKPTKKEAGGITSFQAMATALGGSIGTANIAGVAGAIIIGGPGAIFWMWVAALIGMGVKYAEIVLALRYRKRTDDGYIGGAMLYIEDGLGSRKGVSSKIAKPLAIMFAIFGCLASMIGTTLVQSNTIALSIVDLCASVDSGMNEHIICLVCGIVIAIMVGSVVLGGAKRISKVSSYIVPFMAAAYLLIGIAALYKFRSRLLEAFLCIITDAFGMKQAVGGAVGYAMLATMRTGIARGIYSNEAGIGSAPMAHACASTNDPVKQGMFGVFEVFADTIVVCTMSALVLLSSGIAIPYGEAGISGTAIMLDAFSAAFPRSIMSLFLASSILLFAYTSIIGWSIYGIQCAKYLFGRKSERVFSLIYTLLCIVGAISGVELVWTLGETFNFLMAAPNLVALMLLSNEIMLETKEYSRLELKMIKK